MLTLATSCERRELTYGYDPTVAVIISADWSDMDEVPAGMSVYCYPESGESPTVVTTNDITSATVNLRAGTYNILVFNEVPSSYGTVSFSGLESYETAEINAVSSTTLAAMSSSKNSDDTARDPDEQVAAATYTGFYVSEEIVAQSVEVKSKGDTKAGDIVFLTLDVEPKVVIKTTRVKIRISGIYNLSTADASLYGMAMGYNFSKKQSHDDMVTHSLPEWSSTTYEGDYREGEISASFTCFGLPGQTSSSVAEDYSEWEGQLTVKITLIDLVTEVNEVIPLCDKITTTTGEESKVDDLETNMDVSVDINITSGYGLTDDDDAITLQDVEPATGSGGAFNAMVDDWDEELVEDLEI